MQQHPCCVSNWPKHPKCTAVSPQSEAAINDCCCRYSPSALFLAELQRSLNVSRWVVLVEPFYSDREKIMMQSRANKLLSSLVLINHFSKWTIRSWGRLKEDTSPLLLRLICMETKQQRQKHLLQSSKLKVCGVQCCFLQRCATNLIIFPPEFKTQLLQLTTRVLLPSAV